jgi:hypothetical protein
VNPAVHVVSPSVAAPKVISVQPRQQADLSTDGSGISLIGKVKVEHCVYSIEYEIIELHGESPFSVYE